LAVGRIFREVYQSIDTYTLLGKIAEKAVCRSVFLTINVFKEQEIMQTLLLESLRFFLCQNFTAFIDLQSSNFVICYEKPSIFYGKKRHKLRKFWNRFLFKIGCTNE